ncbi:MAG: hypothetical protein PGN08_12020 [Sphingomonas taxi]
MRRRLRSRSARIVEPFSSKVRGDDSKKPWKPSLHVIEAQFRRPAVSPIDLSDEAGMAQNPKVMGQRGFADREAEGRAGPLGIGRQMGKRRNDMAPMRIGKRRQYLSKLHVVAVGVAMFVSLGHQVSLPSYLDWC